MSDNARTVLGIDPGDRQSALVEWDGCHIVHATKVHNEEALNIITDSQAGDVVIEEIIPFGRFVGKNVVDTARWSGQFQLAAKMTGKNDHLMYRKTAVAHVTGSAKCGDKQVRASLVERFGLPPTKGCPNDVYGKCKISGDKWAAWAVAVTWWDKNIF